MAATTTNFTTGPSTLPDVGVLSYNGCTFSPLFESKVSAKLIKDDANRTVKYTEYVITVDGYVTSADTGGGIVGTMAILRRLLTQQGGALTYQGRGLDLYVNLGARNSSIAVAASNFRKIDVVWGPVPEIIEFQPLGGGLSAKIQWKVTIRVTDGTPRQSGAPLLQFNCVTTVTYTEDYFSGLSIKGVMEVPLSRLSVNNRTLTQTVDNFRNQLDTRIFSGIDLSLFRVTKRDYQVSRDKRSLNFDIAVEEKPYMDLPPACTLAKGNFSVRPAQGGAGLSLWLCTLGATYTVMNNYGRRVSWLAFLALLRLRMLYSYRGYISTQAPNPGAITPVVVTHVPRVARPHIGNSPLVDIDHIYGELLQTQLNVPPAANSRKCLLIDFNISEGIYSDSKTTSFSASWRMVTNFSHILLASGVWRKLPEYDAAGNGNLSNLWMATVENFSGSQSWLRNQVDPALDVVVDFGGG